MGTRLGDNHNIGKIIKPALTENNPTPHHHFVQNYDGRTSHRRGIGHELFDLKNVIPQYAPPNGESTSPDLLPF